MQKNGNYKKGHALTVLFMFLFGALMTLLYLPTIDNLLPTEESFALKCMLGIVFISSLLVSSLNGIVLLPTLAILFGSATALEVDRIRLFINDVSNLKLEIITLFVTVPLFFQICSWGMYSSLVIRGLMDKPVTEYKKNKVSTYTVMLFGAAALAAAQGLINI